MAAKGKYTLPELGYDYAALQPVISAEIMELHHSKHHQTYVNNLNAAEEKLNAALAKGDISAAVALGPSLRFNGGGHLNHSIFWQNLSPNGGGEPNGALATAIQRDFGSFADFKTTLAAASVGVQGSGWGWLGWDGKEGRLRVTTCPNQDPLQATTGLVPLFGIDVWEHAYYLQYKNGRAAYVNAIFDKANWTDVAQRYEAAQK